MPRRPLTAWFAAPFAAPFAALHFVALFAALLCPPAANAQEPLRAFEADLTSIFERASLAVVSIRTGNGPAETIPAATPTPILDLGEVGDDVLNELYRQLTGEEAGGGNLGITREDIQRQVYDHVESGTGMSLEIPSLLEEHFPEAAEGTESSAPPLLPLPAGDSRSGTGFLVTRDGLIVTIADLFEGYGTNPAIELTWHNGLRTAARLRGLDTQTNIALLEATDIHGAPLDFGNARDLEMGSVLLSITCPYGFPPSAHVGICSGVNRRIGPESALATRYERFVQTDLPLYPGGHGGPVLNLNGQVIGMMAATVKQGSWKAVSFAIPSNVLEPIANELREEGSVARGFLGVRLEEPPKTDRLWGQPGVVIAEVMPESPAQKAGLVKGDRILSLDGMSTNSSEDFVWAVSMSRPGRPVELSIFRNGRRQVLPVELAPLEEALER